MRYDATHYRYKYSDINAQQTYLGIDAGVNLFGWALRHRGSQMWTAQQKQSYQRIATYAKHDVPLLRGQFTIGDFYTNGRLMDSIAIRGVQLESDDRMLAASERYYAPVIRGVANTNAIVSVRQNGNLLREVSVPAGAFSIDDLFPTGYGGDLEVEVLEANGEKRTFTVPYTATAQLIRPGYSRYQLSAGRYRYNNEILDNVAQATWQYGLSNNITFNLGAILAKNYHSELIGVAVNTPIGAFSGNATFSTAKLLDLQQKYKGYNLHFSYNTHIELTNTNVTLAAYRYLSRKYYSLQDTILANNRDFVDRQEIDMSSYYYRPKNQFQVTVSQVFKDNWGSVYVNGSTYTYWDSNEKRNEYQIGYGNSYKKLSYSFSFSQGKTSDGNNDRRIYLSLSLPLGDSINSAYVSQTLNYNKENGYYASTSLYGSLGEQGKYNYNIAVSKQKDNSNISFNNNYSSPQARLSASWSRDNKGSQQISFGASGAVVAHPKGITLSNDLGDSFAIIHAKGAKGALINGSVGNKIDYFGNGIVPYIEPYAINYVGLDGNSLPSTVELSATEQSVIPRANQAILVNFETEQGAVVFFELTNDEKDLPPLGTEVFDQNNQSVGVVAQGGTIYTRGIAESGELKLSWGETRCHINYQLPPESDNTMPVIVPVQCQFY
ncbi:fimbria/pilus outer membrane usher protein [Avibacterium paragallinarum]|uniref:fimbria/pilus outer membrane usher protein n=1 Tax=Avibacterium paragallinarum TaxID=728 RepID=UPI0039C74D87